MLTSTLTWYVVYAKTQPTKILATVGVADDLVRCIAYHYDFRDLNLDSKISIMERVLGNERAAWNLHIAYDLARQGVAFDTKLIVSSINTILKSGGESAIGAAKFAYFQVLVGIPVSKLLTAAGVTGIKKFVYGSAIKSAIKGLLP